MADIGYRYEVQDAEPQEDGQPGQYVIPNVPLLLSRR